MFEKLYEWFDFLLGLQLSVNYLSAFHLINRITIVYVLGIFLVKLHRQFMGINTPFNFIIQLILGSIVAASIIGEAPYLPVLCMTLFILLLNFLIAVLCYYSPRFETFIKGTPEVLIKNGEIQWKGMKKNLITLDELTEAIHESAKCEKLESIQKAYFENSGKISIILKKELR